MLPRFTFAAGMLALLALSEPAQSRVLRVCFTPGMDCTSPIVEAIDAAKREILVQAYGFTSCPIIEALARARRRNVDVRVLLDRTNEQKRYYGYIDHLLRENIEPRIDAPPGGIAHKKTIVTDRHFLISGSMNHTWKAQHQNVEVAYFFVGRPARADESNWWQRQAVSRALKPAPADFKPRCDAAEPKTRSANIH